MRHKQLHARTHQSNTNLMSVLAMILQDVQTSSSALVSLVEYYVLQHEEIEKQRKKVEAPLIWAAITHSSFHSTSSSSRQLKPAGTQLWDTQKTLLSPVSINGLDEQG